MLATYYADRTSIVVVVVHVSSPLNTTIEGLNAVDPLSAHSGRVGKARLVLRPAANRESKSLAACALSMPVYRVQPSYY